MSLTDAESDACSATVHVFYDRSRPPAIVRQTTKLIVRYRDLRIKPKLRWLPSWDLSLPVASKPRLLFPSFLLVGMSLAQST
ncbi:hypothetical protein KEM48_014373 [Puccinia striiformis f. sp. tritici PST-130]|nr:hypothetical protein KEM48_014373 [Puccinia striiformis f. sp. tritici PST-130]